MNLSPEIELICPDQRYMPAVGSDRAAGFDLRVKVTTDSITLFPGDVVKLSAGFRVDMKSRDIGLFLLPRSGSGTRGLHIANQTGLIDGDYQGEVFIALRNVSQDPITVNDADRVAQGVFLPVLHPTMKLVNEFSTVTERGEGGFGSTGVK